MPRPSWDDLKAAFSDVAPGEYLTRDLLPIYLEWVKVAGKPEIDAKTLGEALAAETCVENAGIERGLRIWYVAPEGLNCRNWFEASHDSPLST